MPGSRHLRGDLHARRALLVGLALGALLVPARARAEGAKLFVTTPLPLVLGEAEDISAVIELPDTPETEGRPLQVAVNIGRVDPPERVSAGKYRVRYRLPTTKFPQAAILAVWHETGPDASVDFLRIPLAARTKIPAKAAPGSEVRILVGDQTYGPITADKSGTAVVPIVMPPGVKEVIVEANERSGVKRSPLPVKVPQYNRFSMVVTPYLMSPDGKTAATVHVYYDDPLPPTPDKIQISVPNGSIAHASSAQGHYLFRYTPAVWRSERELSLLGAVSGDDTATGRTSILLGNPVPERIISKTPPTSIPADGNATKPIRLLVIDQKGLGVRGQQLRATTTDGTVSAVKEVGAGNYEATLTAPSAVPKAKKLIVELSLTPPVGAPIVAPVEIGVVASTGGTVDAVVEKPQITGPSAPGSLVSLGARIGGTYDAQVGPLAGVEVVIRPRGGERRFAIFALAEVLSISNDFTTPDAQKISSSLARLPVTVGVTYDLASKEDWRGYLGIGGGVVGLAHTIESDFQDAQVFRRIAPVGKVFAGASYAGAFLELGSTYMSISDKSLTIPAVGFSAALGYRLGLF